MAHGYGTITLSRALQVSSNIGISHVIDAFFGQSYMSVVSALVRDKKVDEADLLQFLADLRKQKDKDEQTEDTD